MIIIIEKIKLYDYICIKYKDKIRSIYKKRHKILFNNGDELKIISTRQQIDGLYADVAIGPHAEYITCASKHEKRVWGISDLYNYLENL